MKHEKAGQEGKVVDGSEVDLSLSLHKLLDRDTYNESVGDLNVPIAPIKTQIMEAISEYIDEIKAVRDNIAEQAVEHIYAKETIMTFGISSTVVAFLKEAAKFRKFEVVVPESAPAYDGHQMAVNLAEADIETTVITDSAVFAIMSSVNKVIISTHAVMANGGLLTHTGVHNLAVAAKHHSIPVVVVAGLHKLCPLYAFDQDTFNVHNPPSQIWKFEEDLGPQMDVLNPGFDYVPPEFVDLFITNLGGHNPSYIYRLLAEYYNAQDYEL